MTIEQHRADIALAISQNAVNQLVSALAEARAEIDELKAKLSESAKPKQTS